MTNLQILCPEDKGYMGDPRRGASMGRPNVSGYLDKAGDWQELAVIEGAPPFNLIKIPVGRGGYDPGGAYWGSSRTERLYGYIGPLTDVRGFVWAPNREAAKQAVRAIHQHARFYR